MARDPLGDFISDALMDHLRIVAVISLLIEKKVITMEEYQRALDAVAKEDHIRKGGL